MVCRNFPPLRGFGGALAPGGRVGSGCVVDFGLGLMDIGGGHWKRGCQEKNVGLFDGFCDRFLRRNNEIILELHSM
jgi:hypothetical protein